MTQDDKKNSDSKKEIAEEREESKGDEEKEDVEIQIEKEDEEIESPDIKTKKKKFYHPRAIANFTERIFREMVNCLQEDQD